MLVKIERKEPTTPPIKEIIWTLSPDEALSLYYYLRNANNSYHHGGQPGSTVAYGSKIAYEFVDHIRILEEELRD